MDQHPLWGWTGLSSTGSNPLPDVTVPPAGRGLGWQDGGCVGGWVGGGCGGGDLSVSGFSFFSRHLAQSCSQFPIYGCGALAPVSWAGSQSWPCCRASAQPWPLGLTAGSFPELLGADLPVPARLESCCPPPWAPLSGAQEPMCRSHSPLTPHRESWAVQGPSTHLYCSSATRH